MKVTFSNSFTESKCKAIALMLPGVWHGFGHFAGIAEVGHLFPYLLRHGFIERKRHPWNDYWYQYRLTQQGVVLRAQLKAMGL